MSTITKILSESTLNRIRSAWIEHDTGTITAFRDMTECGDGVKYTKKQNIGKNSILRSKLLKRGYGITKIKGSWIENGGKEVSEASYYVVDIKDSGKLLKDLIELGKDFEQDAITYAEKESDYYAVSTNMCENSWPGFGRVGVKEKLGKPKFGKTGISGFSRVNNRAFVFESYNLISRTDFGPISLRSIEHIDDKDWRDIIL